jgi:multisubunit Na+/H+ antiporter MnhF subunit
MTWWSNVVAGGPRATSVVLAIMALGAALVVWRLVRGPTLSDRVVALDLLAIFVVGAMMTSAIHFNSPVLLQPALALALVAFVGTVGFAQYILKRFYS